MNGFSPTYIYYETRLVEVLNRESGFERVSTYVGSLVNFETAGSRVTLSADITNERFGSRVDKLMSL